MFLPFESMLGLTYVKVDSLFCQDYIQYMLSLNMIYVNVILYAFKFNLHIYHGCPCLCVCVCVCVCVFCQN